MLIDLRSTPATGTLRSSSRSMEARLASQERHFGEPLLWATSDTGDVNTYVHIWVYESAEDRNRKRAALFQDRNG